MYRISSQTHSGRIISQRVEKLIAHMTSATHLSFRLTNNKCITFEEQVLTESLYLCWPLKKQFNSSWRKLKQFMNWNLLKHPANTSSSQVVAIYHCICIVTSSNPENIPTCTQLASKCNLSSIISNTSDLLVRFKASLEALIKRETTHNCTS